MNNSAMCPTFDTSASLCNGAGGVNITCGNSSTLVCNGAAGTNGTNGAAGEPGRNGTDGIGLCPLLQPISCNGVGGVNVTCGDSFVEICNGTTGATGPQGPNGTDGVGLCPNLTTVSCDGLGGVDITCGDSSVTICNGSTGATGPQGPAGADGKNGTDGVGLCPDLTPVSCDGAGGVDITCGDSSVTICNGTQGATGPQGPAGADGKNGTDGVGLCPDLIPVSCNGVGGVEIMCGDSSVTICNGTQGTTGATGATGPAGPTNFAGNTVRVDQVYGNDSTCVRSGSPCLTIATAFTKAASGDVVWIFPGTYSTTSLTIPSGVSVRGLQMSAVVIQQLGQTTSSDLITMGANSMLQDVTLSMTSSTGGIQLRAVVFPAGTPSTARIRNAAISITTTAVGNTGLTVGIAGTGTGIDPFGLINVDSCRIFINQDSGATQGIGIRLSASVITFTVSDTFVYSFGTTGGVGVLMTSNNAVLNMYGGSIYGDAADIKMTAAGATMLLSGTVLVHSSSGGSPTHFSTGQTPNTLVFGVAGAIPDADSRSMYLGSSSVVPAGNIINVLMTKTCFAKSLYVSLRTHTGGTGDTYTVYKNNVATALQVTISAAATTGFNDAEIVSFAQGDLLSVLFATQAASGSTDPVVTVELY